MFKANAVAYLSSKRLSTRCPSIHVRKRKEKPGSAMKFTSFLIGENQNIGNKVQQIDTKNTFI